MAEKKSWILTDIDKGIWVENLELNEKDPALRNCRGAFIRKKTLHGGLAEGVDIVEVCNGALSFTILPTRGMGLWRGDYKGNRLGWNSPARGPVNPKFVNATDRGGLGWLAGFDEWIVRCGLESNGSPGTDIIPSNTGKPVEMKLTLHGRIANIPASYVEIQVVPGDPPEICVVGIVDEAMLFSPQFRLTTRISTALGSNAVTIADEITNLKSTEEEMQLLYHCNFADPFLEKGSRLVLPAKETAPRDARAAEGIDTWDLYPAPAPGFREQCYWHVPLADAKGNSLALLHNSAGSKGVVVRFNVKQLPCVTQWKCCGAKSDGYVTSMEPATNYPNTRMFEREHGRTVKMPAGSKYESVITLEAYETAAGVAKVEQEIASIQGKARPKLHRKPQARYSPEE